MKLEWDKVGERYYETGVSRGVLYMPTPQGIYNTGVAWNGVTSVSESPTGGESNKMYADDLIYLNLFSVEEFEGTIEAYTYPPEFEQYDGLVVPTPGLSIGQQARKTFGLSYQTRLGNDVDDTDLGYKIHLVYGLTVSPSEKAYNSINDSPDPIQFSWSMTSVPVPVPGYRPTSLLTVDSTKVGASELTALENALYGTPSTNPRLPLPEEVMTMLSSGVTQVTPVAPTASGNDVTIPSQTGVYYTVNDIPTDAGVVTITEDVIVVAYPTAGYEFPAVVVDEFVFQYT